MEKVRMASTRYLHEALKKIEEDKNKFPQMSYNEFHLKMNNIPMIFQLKANYHYFREEGYECEHSFLKAKNKTYEEYIDYLLSCFEEKKMSEISSFYRIKQGFEIMKEEKKYLTQFLEDSRFI